MNLLQHIFWKVLCLKNKTYIEIKLNTLFNFTILYFLEENSVFQNNTLFTKKILFLPKKYWI